MLFVVLVHKNQSQFKNTALSLQMNVFKSAFFHCLTQTIFIVVIVWRFIQTPSHLTMEELFKVEKSSNILACPLQYGLLSLQSIGNTYNGENKLACGHKVSDWNIFVLLRCQNKTFIIMSLSYFGFSCKWEILLKCFSENKLRLL